MSRTDRPHSSLRVNLNRARAHLSKPQNLLLLILGLVLSVSTIAPVLSILADTFRVHPGSVDAVSTGLTSGYTFYNWTDLFTGVLRRANLWTPLKNSLLLAVYTCIVTILYGGSFAYLITRTNLKCRKYLSAIYILPYIMPQWTLAVVWQNLFNSNAVTGTSNGLLVSLTGITAPLWWCKGIFPSAMVLALHYAPFAYILIGGIFRNMDANLEEAATILNTPKWKMFLRITIPIVTPAILSTVLLVFSSAMGSYPVPHYLGFTTLSTRYVDMNVNREGQASILAIIMMLLGFAILMINQASTGGRKSYTTVTGKSGQSSKMDLRSGKYAIAFVLILLTLFTGIYPILSFAVETFLPNPGDYSFLTGGHWRENLTTKWWTTSENLSESGMFGQLGILHNALIWNALKGTLLVAVLCALIAGTVGMLVGYGVSKNRRSKWAAYVNSVAFLPYLMPALTVGVAFFIFGSALGIYNTFLLLVLAGTVKYIPFASRGSLNSMLQISGEIEEAAIIQGIPWHKRMTRILLPIQKSSIISGYMLPFMTCLRELTLFMLLCSQAKILTTMLGYFDEMGLYAFSSGINLILIVLILLCNFGVNKLTGASLDKGIGGA